MNTIEKNNILFSDTYNDNLTLYVDVTMKISLIIVFSIISLSFIFLFVLAIIYLFKHTFSYIYSHPTIKMDNYSESKKMKEENESDDESNIMLVVPVANACDDEDSNATESQNENEVENDEKQKNTYYVVIDFESFGGIPKLNGFTQFGSCIGNYTTGEIIETFNMYANQDGFVKEERCMREFWDKHEDLLNETLEKCEKSTSSPEQVVESWVQWLRTIVEKIKVDENEPDPNILILTDCATYDSGMLKAFSNYDTLYLINSTPRDIIDVSAWMMGACRQPLTTETVDSSTSNMVASTFKIAKCKPIVNHTHNACDDAIHIFEKFRYYHEHICNTN